MYRGSAVANFRGWAASRNQDISVDNGLHTAALAPLAGELRDERTRDMVTSSLPILGTGASVDGQSGLLPDPNSIENISDAPVDDSLDTYVASGGPAGGH